MLGLTLLPSGSASAQARHYPLESVEEVRPVNVTRWSSRSEDGRGRQRRRRALDRWRDRRPLPQPDDHSRPRQQRAL